MFYCEQCKGCAYNNNGNKKGCDAYKEMPFPCNNYLTEEEWEKREKKIKWYEQRQSRPLKPVYKPLSGGSGKWVLTRV